MLVIEKKSCADLGRERGGGREGVLDTPSLVKIDDFFSISHSKVPKIGIKPHPHPNHPRKTQFSLGPAPSQEKVFLDPRMRT